MEPTESYRYQVDSADLVLWAAWVHECYPFELQAILADPAGTRAIQARWHELIDEGDPPLVALTVELVYRWAQHQETEFAYAMSLQALPVLGIPGLPFTEKNVQELLLGAALFFRDAKERIQGWCAAAQIADESIWAMLQDEYLSVFRAKLGMAEVA